MMAADPLQLRSLNFEPLYYRPHGGGDWSRHVPFAYDLVSSLRPRIIVELGTYYGESYFAFCQGVAEAGLACQLFAVDTWRGDAHTGAYAEAVFREVVAHNQEHYAAFSTLLRESFDEARRRFADGSIDLLHIDGLHTYEAVRHDFETWFPKVNAGGIVLLHDTCIRRADFGVWRLWRELEDCYESFEFPHGSGLGVIRKPGDATSGLTDLLFQDPVRAEGLRRFYRICGERLEYKDRLERQKRRGKWDLLVKLYWKATGQDYSEACSLHVYAEATTSPKGIRIELPGAVTFDQVRIDLLECPAFMRLHALRFIGRAEEALWSLPMNDAGDLVCAGLALTPESGGCILAARLAGEERSIVVKMPESILDRVAAGASLEFEFSGLEPEEYSTALTAILHASARRTSAAESNLVLSQEEAAARGRALRESQQEAAGLARALGESQEEAAGLARALGESQEEAAGLARALRESQEEAAGLARALRESQEEAAGLARTLREIESSTIWKLTRRLRRPGRP